MSGISKQLVILAGGQGTRLKSVLPDKPKPLALVAGRSLLERQLDLAADYGLTHVHLMTHHFADQIREAIGDGRKWGIRVQYHVEDVPRGTAGCVLHALAHLGDTFLVVYGDTLLNIDLDRVWDFHRQQAADATLLVHPNDHPYDSDLIELDAENRVRLFHKVPHPEDEYLPNLVNAALYVIQRESLRPWQETPGKLDFARDLFPKMLDAGCRIMGLRTREYIKDMGTPDRLQNGERDVASGRLEKLAHGTRMPAVFFDRDGTLNVDVGRLSRKEDLVLIDGASESVRAINRSSRLAVLATNQPVLARGDCTEAGLQSIHNKLESLLGRQGAYLDAIYYCPHHPDAGFAGERPELKILCSCRKPNAGMFVRAAQDLNIDLGTSWLIGDTTTDVAAARHAGLKSALVRTGAGGRDYRYPVRPDFEFFDALEAAQFITEQYDQLLRAAETALGPWNDPGLIVVGGLSRSGKSTWAAVCQHALRKRGRTAHIVPLDCWIQPPPRRGADVRGRFRIRELVDSVRTCLESSAPIEIDLPFYDRWTRQLVPEPVPRVCVAPGEILIVEGVLALDVPELRGWATQSFYVECEETTRVRRFEREYRLRGYSAGDIEQLYREREADEHGLVRATRPLADRVVTLEAVQTVAEVGT